MKRAVVLLHGLFMKPFSMNRLARKFRKNGFEVFSFGYATKGFNQKLTLDQLGVLLATIDAPSVYLVGHSMGGLIARLYCTLNPASKVTKLITLGTPHLGSYVASYLQKSKFGALLGSSGDAGLIAKIPEWPGAIPLGCVIGMSKVGANMLLAPFHGRRDVSDGTVFLEEAYLVGAHDNTLVPYSHSGMLFSNKVFSECLQFIEESKFSKSFKIQIS